MYRFDIDIYYIFFTIVLYNMYMMTLPFVTDLKCTMQYVRGELRRKQRRGSPRPISLYYSD